MKRLGFIGAGNMAEALARGLLANKLFGSTALIASDVDVARRRKFSRGLSIRTVADNLEVVSVSDTVVIAVKPQTIDAVLDEIARLASTGPASETTKNRGKGRHKLERK